MADVKPKTIEERLEAIETHLSNIEKRVTANEHRVRWRELRQALAFVLILVVAAFSYAESQAGIDRNNELSRTVQTGLIQGCVTSGNPGRKATREGLHEEIREVQAEMKRADELKPQFLPDIPPATFKRLTREARERQEAKIERKQKRLKKYEPVQCVEQYSSK